MTAPIPEPDYTVLASAADIRAVVRIARMARHLAEDPATDRLAALCERTPQRDCPEYAEEFGHEDDIAQALDEARWECQQPNPCYCPDCEEAEGQL